MMMSKRGYNTQKILAMKNFNPLDHPICFSPVLRLSPSTWLGHIPFAMFLTSILKPGVIVELGTYYGSSYCAFCQAVRELKLDTSCYAVDTWEGDPQSGFFGAEVLEDLRKYHDPLYGSFSRLVQNTFDAASEKFDNKSIDLLHIDGFHTYEAVTSDFETWLPKMSEHGVILFHDINVRERDFGAWKFWEETKSNFPSFEFTHSHGLGVLAVGDKCLQPFQEFLDCAADNPARIRDFFHQMGARLQTLQENQSLRQTIEQNQIDFALGEQARQLRSGTQNLGEQDQSFEDREQQLEFRKQELKEQEQQFHERERQFQELENQLQAKSEELKIKIAAHEAKELSIKEETQQLYAKSWQLQEALFRLENGRNGRNGQNGQLDNQSFSRAVLENVRKNGQMPAYEKDKLVLGIVTFNNSEKQISQLLKSICAAQKRAGELPVELEIFVVDNGRETYWEESSVKIAKFESCGNVGFGKAMNRLMSTAFADNKTKWFLCVNPDGIMHHNTLRELLTLSGEHPDSLIEARQFPEEHLKQYDPKTLETPWASGACLLIRKNIFEEIGQFDPHFFMYMEDIDFSWRARSAGFSVKIAPNALFGHAVLDRQLSVDSDKMFLLSGRYLSFKWREQKFFDWTEKELIQRGYFQSLSELPKLPELAFDKLKLNPEIPDFAHYFHFSPARW